MSFDSGSKRSYSECLDLTNDDVRNDVQDANESKSSAPRLAELLSRTISTIAFRVFGSPEVLERHRVSRNGHIYNPSKTKQEIFRAQCTALTVCLLHWCSTCLNS